jgi:hypothetical protein
MKERTTNDCAGEHLRLIDRSSMLPARALRTDLPQSRIDRTSAQSTAKLVPE